MSILILSRSENVHADMVSEYCAQHASVHRINFDFDALSPENLSLVTLGNTVPDEMPCAVFVHHPRVSYCKEWFADEIERKLFLASWDSVKEWMEAKYHRAL